VAIALVMIAAVAVGLFQTGAALAQGNQTKAGGSNAISGGGGGSSSGNTTSAASGGNMTSSGNATK
jgi:hypothetical protein